MREKKLTKRQMQAINTKNKLYATARELFAEYGYEAVSVDEIVEKAGTSKGAFYAHFKSKDQVILEQFAEIDDYYLEVYERIKRRRTATGQMLAFIKAQHEYVADTLGLDFIKVVYYSRIIKNEGIRPFSDETRPLYTIVRKIIEAGQEKGEFRQDISAVELTRIITRCMRGTIYDWCVQNGEFNIKENGQRFFRLILEGLRPSAE